MSKETGPRGGGSQDFTSGSLTKSLFAMAGPMLIGMIAFASVNVVDTFFIGQLGLSELAAMGFAFPIIFFASGFASGIGVGVQSVVSRALGAKDIAKARAATIHGITLAVLVACLVMMLGLTWMHEIFALVGTSEAAMPHVEDYMSVWFVALVFYAVPLVGGSALAAKGDVKSPMIFFIGGSLINLILDPILIFGAGPVPAMGVTGAALATAISRAVVAVATFWILWRDEVLRPQIVGLLRGFASSCSSIARVAAPQTFNLSVGPISLAVLTRVMAGFGDAPVAAYAAGSRIDGLAMLVAAAAGMGLAPIVGQNWGAGLHHRVLAALKLCAGVSAVWGIAAWLCLALSADYVATAFLDNPEAVDALRLYFYIVPIGYGAAGAAGACGQVLNATDHALFGSGASLLQGILAMGAAAVGYWAGDFGVLLGALVALSFVQLIVIGSITRFVIRRGASAG